MIPTLNGRIQTRIFLILFVGIPWTLIITPFLPNNRDVTGGSLIDTYKTTFTVLGIVLVLAVFGWELIYHFLQQFRWEKDWPVMFTFFLVIPEAIVAKLVFDALDIGTKFGATATNATFWWHIVTTWMVMWLFVLGPIKVLFIRWRFSGGRIFF
ncbi:MAG: hypothetical protein JWM34_4567 [Ilumatobacteraceae bacterium]|nr:hypothetical protein [Ilumatobacteraceae bacterium]